MRDTRKPLGVERLCARSEEKGIGIRELYLSVSVFPYLSASFNLVQMLASSSAMQD
jgi:hypothetical protein